MNIFFVKNHTIYLLTILVLFTSCQLNEPANKHGILFLENRSNQLTVNKDNKNDILKLIGTPHTKTIASNDWIYIERILTKGGLHRLGKNVLKTNNVLVLTFDKYGILKDKKFLNKDDINKMNFSKKITENNLAKVSFVESFLSSIRSKMYSNKK
jgi:outer membrane protein assembly factor BamE (lipoprotein component of BamABCDE complex)